MAEKTYPLILVIDDDELLLRLLEASLAGQGFAVRTAANGEEGLELAATIKPDLIVLDIQMPDISGFTVISRLRSSPNLLFTPVIFCSSRSDAKSRLHGFSLGADDYLTKPFHLDELGFRVKRALGRRTETEPQLRDQIHSPASSKLALQGDLGQVGLSSVLLLIEMESKSGVLRVSSDKGMAHVTVNKGRIFSAECQPAENGNGNLASHDIEAAYEVLSWSSGSFKFIMGDVGEDDNVQIPTTFVVMEAARRCDEFERTDSAGSD